MAQNTPIIRPDRIRKEPMYWATRSSITCHADTTTTHWMKAVSGTNHSDKPSTPRL